MCEEWHIAVVENERVAALLTRAHHYEWVYIDTKRYALHVEFAEGANYWQLWKVTEVIREAKPVGVECLLSVVAPKVEWYVRRNPDTPDDDPAPYETVESKWTTEYPVQEEERLEDLMMRRFTGRPIDLHSLWLIRWVLYWRHYVPPRLPIEFSTPSSAPGHGWRIYKEYDLTLILKHPEWEVKCTLAASAQGPGTDIVVEPKDGSQTVSLSALKMWLLDGPDWVMERGYRLECIVVKANSLRIASNEQQRRSDIENVSHILRRGIRIKLQTTRGSSYLFVDEVEQISLDPPLVGGLLGGACNSAAGCTTASRCTTTATAEGSGTFCDNELQELKEKIGKVERRMMEQKKLMSLLENEIRSRESGSESPAERSSNNDSGSPTGQTYDEWLATMREYV